MKKPHLFACLMVMIGLQSVGAQGPGVYPSKRPAFSPYLNLNRQGNSAALNYYGLVRPQLSANDSIQQLQQQSTVLQQQQQQESAAPSELPPTGHASGFLNHNRFFLNRGGSTPLGGRATAAPPTSHVTAPKKAR